MKNASRIEYDDGRPVENLRVWCTGPKSAPEYGRPGGAHEPTQVALFLHEKGDTRPDDRDVWEIGDGHENVETRFMLPPEHGAERIHLDARRGAVLRTAQDETIRVDLRRENEAVAKWIVRCPDCSVEVPRDRSYLEGLFSRIVSHVTPDADGVWEVDIKILALPRNTPNAK